MAIDYKALNNAMIKAAEDAKTAAENTDDGGTCNLDFVALENVGRSSRKIVEIAISCGLRAYESFWYKRRIVAINTPYGGQANRREAATRAIYKALLPVQAENGLSVDYMYIMD